MSAVTLPNVALKRRVRAQRFATTDHWLLGAALLLLALGLVMVASASISSADKQLGQPFYYLIRQSAYIGIGLFGAYAVWRMPMDFWNKAGPVLLVIAYVLLIAVLIPGIGHSVNGARRWIPLVLFNLQVSEPAKLFAFIYIAGYLVRHGDEVRSKVVGLRQADGAAGRDVRAAAAGTGLRRRRGAVHHGTGHDVPGRCAALAVWRFDRDGRFRLRDTGAVLAVSSGAPDHLHRIPGPIHSTAASS